MTATSIDSFCQRRPTAASSSKRAEECGGRTRIAPHPAQGCSHHLINVGHCRYSHTYICVYLSILLARPSSRYLLLFSFLSAVIDADIFLGQRSYYSGHHRSGINHIGRNKWQPRAPNVYEINLREKVNEFYAFFQINRMIYGRF